MPSAAPLDRISDGTTAATRARRRPLVGWLVAQAVSITGTRISMVAIPWFVLTTSGSATRAGLVAFAELAPYVLAKALGGPLIDRWGARRISILADLASVAVVGAIPLFHHLGLLGFPLLMVLVALAGALRGPGDGAKVTLVPSVAHHAKMPLERVTGLEGTVERLGSTLGALAAGLLVAAAGPTQAVLLDAVSFGLASALIWLTVPADTTGSQPTAENEVAVNEPYLAQLRAGWRFLRADRLLVAITTMVAITNLLDQAYVVVFVPVWAQQSGGGAGAIGTVFATFSAAAVVGSVVATAIAARLPRRLVYLIAFLLVGAPRFVVLAFDSPLSVVLAVAVIGGFSAGFINPILSAVIFERIPSPLMGRVTALNTALCWMLLPFGGLVAGATVTAVGLAPALVIFGAFYFGVTTFPALLPQWREIDRRSPVASAEVPGSTGVRA